MPRVIDMVVDMIAEMGIDHVFGLPGGVTPFLLEEFYKRKDKFTTIVARQEGAAAIMADVYGRITRKPGILIGQGPFIATNGGVGIIEAYMAGSPIVIITDASDWNGINQHAPYQCGTGEYGSINVPNIMRSMTKYTTVATNPQEVVYGVELAIKHAISGRPGPTCVIARWQSMIGIIKDPMELRPPLHELTGLLNVSPPCISPDDTQKIARYLLDAESPVLLCGRGIHASNAYEELQELAELIGMPVATSYMGKSSIVETHDLSLGVMGGLAQKLANETIRGADVILAVGTCLAPENTVNCSIEFIDPSRQKLIHVDIDPRNAAWTYPVTLGVTSDAKLALKAIINEIKNLSPNINVNERINAIRIKKEDIENEYYTSKFYNSDNVPIEPERLVKEINEILSSDDIIVLDAGNSRMWFTKLLQTKNTGQLIAGGGVAGMCWGTSAAIATKLLYKDRNVVEISGDGSMLMGLYNWSTLKELNLPLAYIVMNNSALGNVRDYLSRKGRPMSDVPKTNFANIAKSMGIEGIRVEELSELKPALQNAFTTDKPLVVDVVVSQGTNLRIRQSV